MLAPNHLTLLRLPEMLPIFTQPAIVVPLLRLLYITLLDTRLAFHILVLKTVDFTQLQRIMRILLSGSRSILYPRNLCSTISHKRTFYHHSLCIRHKRRTTKRFILREMSSHSLPLATKTPMNTASRTSRIQEPTILWNHRFQENIVRR